MWTVTGYAVVLVSADIWVGGSIQALLYHVLLK